MTRRAACGHRRCTAAREVRIAAAPFLLVSLPWLMIRPSWQAAACFAASVTACGAALAVTCGTPGDRGTPGDPPLPRRWARKDWAELDALTETTKD